MFCFGYEVIILRV